VFNALGQEIFVLADRIYPPGRYQAVFPASDLSSGVYLYRMEAGSFQQTRVMIIVR